MVGIQEIPGFPGYGASRCGLIFSLRKALPAKLYLQKTPKGYLKAELWRGGKPVKRFVHRLVIETFVGPPPFEGAQCRHLNDVKADNRVENLAWGSGAENMGDWVGNGYLSKSGERVVFLSRYGESNPMSKLKTADVKTIRLELKRGASVYGLSKRFGVSTNHIKRIRDGLSWKHVSIEEGLA